MDLLDVKIELNSLLFKKFQVRGDDGVVLVDATYMLHKTDGPGGVLTVKQFNKDESQLFHYCEFAITENGITCWRHLFKQIFAVDFSIEQLKRFIDTALNY
jgi:hypothetical protein